MVVFKLLHTTVYIYTYCIYDPTYQQMCGSSQDAKFVEERRKQLQGYLRMVMNKLIQTLPEFTARPTKETLLQLLPFCQ